MQIAATEKSRQRVATPTAGREGRSAHRARGRELPQKYAFHVCLCRCLSLEKNILSLSLSLSLSQETRKRSLCRVSRDLSQRGGSKCRPKCKPSHRVSRMRASLSARQGPGSVSFSSEFFSSPPAAHTHASTTMLGIPVKCGGLRQFVSQTHSVQTWCFGDRVVIRLHNWSQPPALYRHAENSCRRTCVSSGGHHYKGQ